MRDRFRIIKPLPEWSDWDQLLKNSGWSPARFGKRAYATPKDGERLLIHLDDGRWEAQTMTLANGWETQASGLGRTPCKPT
jgi:hypothetical protein